MRAWRAMVVVLALLASCGGEESAGKPKVAVSIFPLYDVARRVAGDRLEVVLVLPPGRSEHGYEPTPREVARVAGARLGVVVGLEMDPWATRIIRSASGDGVAMLELGPALDPRRLSAPEVGVDLVDHDEHGEHEHHEGALDPHFWLDPLRMQRAVDLYVEAFARIDPEGEAAYRERGDAVKAELAALHRRIEASARGWRSRTIVTFHGSFGYFAERYGLRIAAVIEPFPGREPTPRYMQEVLSAIRASGAVALFSEPQLDPRPARVIADQAGVALHELDPVGGTQGVDTYERLMESNVRVLDRALGDVVGGAP